MAHMPPGMHHELPNSLSLAPGETKRLTWRFGAAGTLEFACHEPGHYDAGNARTDHRVVNFALNEARRS
jgi:uncharacterized cupredoxin-like copper-binding protein